MTEQEKLAKFVRELLEGIAIGVMLGVLVAAVILVGVLL